VGAGVGVDVEDMIGEAKDVMDAMDAMDVMDVMDDVEKGWVFSWWWLPC
jgi:flavin-binding protein dodecin